MRAYAAVMVFSPITRRWELMSSRGRVIVFDTAEMAWNWLPLLGGGRTYSRHLPTLSISFLEISPTAPNRARVVCPYRPDEPVPWKRHIIWSEWWNSPQP